MEKVEVGVEVICSGLWEMTRAAEVVAARNNDIQSLVVVEVAVICDGLSAMTYAEVEVGKNNDIQSYVVVEAAGSEYLERFREQVAAGKVEEDKT